VATPVFTDLPDLSYITKDVWPQEHLQGRDAHRVKVVLLAPLSRREFTLSMARTNSERRTIMAFLVEARKMGLEPFYFKDPMVEENARVAVPLTLVAGNVYSLPTTITSEEFRFFPINDANLVAKDGGVPVVGATAQTDARTITYPAPPAGATTADFHAYRLCMLATPDLEWSGQSVKYFTTSPAIREILRAS
jgi:hypothetical protein